MSFLFGSAPQATSTTNATVNPTQEGILAQLAQILATGSQAPGVQTNTGQLAPGTQPLQATSLAGLENVANAVPGTATPAQNTASTAGLSALTSALGYQAPQINATQAFDQGVVQPLTTNFNTNVLPGIAGQYGQSAGGAFSSDSLAARQQAGLNLDQTLAQSGSQFALGAAQANQSANLAGQGDILSAIGLAPSAIGGIPNAAASSNTALLTSLLQGGGAAQYGIQSGIDTAQTAALTQQQTQNQQLIADMIASFSPQTLQTNTVATGGQTGLVQGLLTGAAGNAGLGTALTALLSDERVKEDIKRVGKLDNDLNVYQFKYKGLPETHIGLIAQEVERKRPEAIVESGGLKYVRYDLATLLEAA